MNKTSTTLTTLDGIELCTCKAKTPSDDNEDRTREANLVFPDLGPQNNPQLEWPLEESNLIQAKEYKPSS